MSTVLICAASMCAASVCAAAPTAHTAGPRSAPFALTGDQVALIMGGSGAPTPSPQYVDTATALYLQPLGFHGTAESLTTPELFTDRVLSETQGADILTREIQDRIAAGAVDAGNPLFVFGYSQSSALSGLAMHQLHAAGVPGEDLRFVLVGDPAAPNGGIFTTFGMSGGEYPDDTTPDDLYPTDVYTMEYDPVSDWPRYSSNLLSDLNAMNGLYFEHLAYLGVTPEQIADAVPLETTGSLVNYFVIPAQILPLLAPLLLMPVIGKPLYDLLEPVTRILVNLGYGSITDGWNSGPADVVHTVDWGLPDLDAGQVLAALDAATQAGAAAFLADLADPATYQPHNIVDSPALTELISQLYNVGLLDAAHPASILTVLEAFANMNDPSTFSPF